MVSDPAVDYLVFTTRIFGARGYAKFSSSGSYRAAVPAIEDVSSGNLYMDHLVSTDAWDTRLVFLNTTDEDRGLILDYDGVVNRLIPVPAKSRRVVSLSELYGGNPPAGFRSGVVRGAEGILGIAVFEGADQMYGVVLEEALAETVYYPHIPLNKQQWDAGVVLYNPRPEVNEITVTTYTGSGNMLESSMMTLGGYENYVRSWTRTGMSQDAEWCKMEGSAALTGFLAFFQKMNDQASAINTLDAAKMSGIFPKVETRGWTELVLLNVGSGEAEVSLSAYDDPGIMVASDSVMINPGAKVVGMAEDLFLDDISAATYITFSSDHPIVGLQQNGSDNALDALPAL
jgi:hypothetical protein